MKILICVFFASCFLGSLAWADEVDKKVNVALGEKLIRLALNATQYKNSGFEDPPEDAGGIFLIYPVLGATEGFLAHFAVNPWTGDVWNMDQCQQISSTALSKEQKKIKATFNKKEFKEYARLSSLRPYRMYNLESCP